VLPTRRDGGGADGYEREPSHEEQWDAKNNATAKDGFFGKMQEVRKKVTAAMVDAGVDSTPVDQK
jgi:hypothetical protein